MFAGVLFAVAYIAYERVESPTNAFFGRTFTGVAPGHRIVALTFDDGPNDPATSRILDVLREQHVHATFFVVGTAVTRAPDDLKRMVREGHAIGNHSWTHSNLTLLTRSAVDEELERTEVAISDATGQRPAIARPPFGARDFAVLDEFKRHGYACVLWSVPLANDWENNVDARTIAARILGGAHDGGIIVLHDGDRGLPADRIRNVEATRLIVEGLRARGFRFVTVPEMMKEGRAAPT